MRATTTRRVWVLPLLGALPAVMGCLDILGFKDPVLDECAPAGCTGGGGSGAGGNTITTTGGGGSGGVGGSNTGGGGGAPFECFPVGTEFDVLAESDIPGADDNSTLFIVPEPGSTPPRAHVVARFDIPTGTLVARTVRGFNDVGAITAWFPPPGGSRYVDGYAAADKVVVLGQVAGSAGTTVAEIQIMKNASNEVQGGDQADVVELPRPFDCEAPGAQIGSVAFSRTGGTTSYAATWDDCVPGERRLYWSDQGGPQLVRQGQKSDPSLALAGFARVGNAQAMTFFDGKSSGYSAGASLDALKPYKAVVLDPDESKSTAPVWMVSVSPNALAVLWSVFGSNTIVPVQIRGRLAASGQLAMLEDAAAYPTVATYEDLPKVTVWGRPTVGQGVIVSGGFDLDGSVARFSVLSSAGAPLALDRVVSSGTSGSIGTVAAAPFGPSGVLVAWKSINASVVTVRGRLFECE